MITGRITITLDRGGCWEMLLKLDENRGVDEAEVRFCCPLVPKVIAADEV